jgi:hypothetical protein
MLKPNVAVEWLTLLLHTQVLPGSNLSFLTEVYCGLPQLLNANAETVP